MEKISADSVPIETMGLVVGFAHFGKPALVHRHSEIEMVFAEGGPVHLLFGGKPVTLDEGQVALFWAVVPHFAVKCENNAKLWWVKVPTRQFFEWKMPDELVQSLLHGQFVRDPNPRFPVMQLAQVNMWLDHLRVGGDERRAIVLLELEARLREIALNVELGSSSAANKARARLDSSEVERVDRMIGYIARNYGESLTVDDVAREASLQPSYAMRLFRARFGTSIMNYVTQHRLAHAQRMLVTTNDNVLDILLDAGFGSVTQFYTLFKRHCGCTPVEYRNAR